MNKIIVFLLVFSYIVSSIEFELKGSDNKYIKGSYKLLFKKIHKLDAKIEAIDKEINDNNAS